MMDDIDYPCSNLSQTVLVNESPVESDFAYAVVGGGGGIKV